MSNRNFAEEIKYQWHSGGMHIRLIGINLIIFLIIRAILVFVKLGSPADIDSTVSILQDVFALQGNLSELIRHPWGIVTNIFSHIDGWHFFFNMLMLFFIGQIFVQVFSSKRLLHTYILGGILGSLVEILANNIFPGYGATNFAVLGASGAIMAMFMAVAFKHPQMKLNLFGVLPVPIIVLAAIYLISNFISLGNDSNTAHFAHLGGALFGYLSILNFNSKKNIVTTSIRITDSLKEKWKGFRNPSKMRVKKGGNPKVNYNTRSDEAYVEHKKQKQEVVDAILDKISKSGYDSLTKKEKQILFEQSNNG